MKNIYRTFALALTGILLAGIDAECAAQNSYESIKEIRGKVRRIEERQYHVKDVFGEIEKAEQIGTYIVEFDENGDTVLEQRKHIGYPKAYKNQYIYDDLGQLRNVVSYDYDADTLVSQRVYRFNDNNKPVQINTYNYNGELSDMVLKIYDVSGNIISEETHYSDKSWCILYDYDWDTKGRKKRKIVRASKRGELIHSIWYKYDEIGNLSEKEEYSKLLWLNRHTSYLYNESDTLYEEEINEIDDDLKFITDIISYDSYRNIVRWEIVRPSVSRIYFYENKYDEKGNCTKVYAMVRKDKTSMPEPYYLCERTIEYWD